jgi:hypothetical protein
MERKVEALVFMNGRDERDDVTRDDCKKAVTTKAASEF